MFKGLIFLGLNLIIAWSFWQFTPVSNQERDAVQPRIQICQLAGGNCDARQVNMRTLWSYLQTSKQPPEKQNKLWLEFYLKSALPWASFFTTLLVAPLALLLAKQGNAFAISLSIGIVFVWYLLFALFQSLGELGVVSPFLGAWIQNLVFAGLGLGVYVYLHR